jgi:hypothetical protein
MTGTTSGSSSGSKSVQENWDTPISQLTSKVGGNMSGVEEYLLVTKDSEGQTKVYSNQSKNDAPSFLESIQGIFSRETESTH